MELKVWRDKRYQVAADSIRCTADKEGCEVFTIEGKIGSLSILAHDRTEAEFTYKMEIQNDPHWCPLCESLECYCDEVEED